MLLVLHSGKLNVLDLSQKVRLWGFEERNNFETRLPISSKRYERLVIYGMKQMF